MFFYIRHMTCVTKLKKSFAFFVPVFFLLLSSRAEAQLSPDAQKANWVFTIADNVTWPSEDTVNYYTIGVYGYSTGIPAELDKLSSSKTIKQHAYKVVQFKKVRDIVYTHILYIDGKYNDDFQQILEKIGYPRTLIFTDNCTDSASYMINLLLKGNNSFEVNSHSILKAGLMIDEKVLARGGRMSDLDTLLIVKEIQLEDKERVLDRYEAQLREKKKDIDSKTKENAKQEERNRLREYELKNKEVEIQEQKDLANKLMENAQRLKSILRKNNLDLRNQEKQMAEKQHLLTASSEEFESKKQRISEHQVLIEEHEALLEQQRGQIDRQDSFIWGTSIFAGVILLLVIIFFISSFSTKRKNRQLALINEEADRQKEHIWLQREQLLQINKELEKLSIVASRTDNAVTIMDYDGNIEWVNNGFTNMYGYTIEDLRNDDKYSLTRFYTNDDIENIKLKCIVTVNSEIFESHIVKKDLKTIYVQTTLTPILNEYSKISRLVTIDTDITKIKEQEAAIVRKGKMLISQRDELASQKEKIEEQNQHINTSIGYAKTIQDTVMPLEVNLSKYFNYFVLFRPLQIVSGDFYWFTAVADRPELFFAATVDCTGHGVPGAFMSLIGSRLLAEIIVERAIYSPSQILSNLNKELISSLKQQDGVNTDSMEVCLCKFEKLPDNKYHVTFAGAKSPLYVYHYKSASIEKIRSDRYPVGGFSAHTDKETNFTEHELQLDKADIVYMTSDGYIKQPDANGNRFTSERFEKVLASVGNLSMKEQKENLENTLDQYISGTETIDDITVFGVKLI